MNKNMKDEISILDIPSKNEPRIKTGIKAFDSFIGGGFIDSQCILLAGQPGAGKSTMLLQLSTILSDKGEKVLYFSGEESLGQIKLRADRLGTLRQDIILSNTIKLEDIYKAIERINPKFVIIDSIQMLYSDKVRGEKGSEKQAKACLLQLIEHIKVTDKILIAIGHANKAGQVAGVMTLQHMVDTVLFVTVVNHVRTLVTLKNRFGSIDETLPLTMEETGFEEININGPKKTLTEKLFPNINTDSVWFKILDIFVKGLTVRPVSHSNNNYTYNNRRRYSRRNFRRHSRGGGLHKLTM